MQASKDPPPSPPPPPPPPPPPFTTSSKRPPLPQLMLSSSISSASPLSASTPNPPPPPPLPPLPNMRGRPHPPHPSPPLPPLPNITRGPPHPPPPPPPLPPLPNITRGSHHPPPPPPPLPPQPNITRGPPHPPPPPPPLPPLPNITRGPPHRPPPPPPPPPPSSSSVGTVPLPPPQAPTPPGVVPPSPPVQRGSRGVPGPSQPPGLKGLSTLVPPARELGEGRATVPSSGKGHGSSQSNPPTKAPLDWVKLTRVIQGSIWADSQKHGVQSRAPEIDLSELKSLFSTTVATDFQDKSGVRRGAGTNKPETIHLIDMRRANNCEIMLTKINMPLPDMISSVLALDTSVLDIDQVENLIKYFPTKEEMELLKCYNGNKQMLGRCEQFFLELMKVPRMESKLRVFSLRITFSNKVSKLRTNLSTIGDACREVQESLKLRQIMHTILTLGNALNQGTAQGSAVGFRLGSLLKLSDTRARNNKMTLMNYLCKLLAEKMPELLDFDKDLIHLEAASKIQVELVAEEMQAVIEGVKKVEQELTASINDGDISVGFRTALKSFLDTAEADVTSLTSLYSDVGRKADSLSLYFGEDPACCPFEQVTSILVMFVNLFNVSREENERNAEAEEREMEKEAEQKCRGC